jgi:hypothetical protein
MTPAAKKVSRTVGGKLLLGWMPRSEAVKSLTELCVFDQPLNEIEAVGLWESYRDKVAALPKLNSCHPTSLQRTLAENLEITKFVKAAKKRGAKNIVRVVKVDPMGLVVHQFQIILDRANKYLALMQHARQRMHVCLGIGLQENFSRVRRGAGVTIIDVPHCEFGINFLPNNNFQLFEFARFISAADLSDRTLLWAGYHRTYAVASQIVPEGTVRSLLATLVVNDPDRFLSVDSERPEVRDTVRGERPALFRDFFNEDLCMNVRLRKLRVELHVPDNSRTCLTKWEDDES